MPVSSLEFSLVDAIKEPSSDTDSGSLFGDESRDRLEKPNFTSKTDDSREAESQKEYDFYESLGQSRYLSDGTTRADLWAHLLGLTGNKEASLRSDLSDDTPNAFPQALTEKRGFLLNFDGDNHPDQILFSVNDLPPHKDEAQVMLDVKRSFTVASHYNTFNSVGNSSYTTILSSEDIEAMRKRLYCLIVRVLRTYPALNYYQGYHDVASIVLLVCNDRNEISDEKAFCILEALTLNHLRDYMISDIALTINHLRLIPLIVEQMSPDLFGLIKHTNNTFSATGGTYYDYKFLPALSSVLTLFSHDITNMNLLMSVWDFIIGHGSVAACAYIYVSMLRHYETKIFGSLGLGENLDFEEVDLDLAHSLLSPAKLFSEISELQLTEILEQAARLIQTHPVQNSNSKEPLATWFKEFNKNSVILTTSRLTTIPFVAQDVSTLPSPEELRGLLILQESQQRAESAHEATMLQDAFDRIDSLSTSIDSAFADGESSRSTLDSSLMSLKAASSSLNSTLIHSSSNLIKKIVSLESSGSNDGSRPHGKRHISTYKLSLTIGFVGVLLHFLLKQSLMGGILRFPPRAAFHAAARHMRSVGGANFVRFTDGICASVNHLKEYGPVRELAEITQVGLGSMKKSIYTLGLQQ
ncbi:hypothetical protein OXX59_002334 [Metschnikowia pulcherrima]